MHTTILQFVDDTIIIIPAHATNLKTIFAMLYIGIWGRLGPKDQSHEKWLSSHSYPKRSNPDHRQHPAMHTNRFTYKLLGPSTHYL
jgi:ADP-heptose:LPS heptosyltransferase